MFVIRKHIEIDAGHRIPEHNGHCRYLHGHRYRVEVAVAGTELVDDGHAGAGMLLDFGALKAALVAVVHNVYDHRMMLYEEDPLVVGGSFQDAIDAAGIMDGVVIVPMIPTAEGLAEFWGRLLYGRLTRFLGANKLYLQSVTVRETPTSTAEWFPPGNE